MADAVLTITADVRGNLISICETLTMLVRALDGHGHEWTAEEQAMLTKAARLLANAAGRPALGPLDTRICDGDV